MNTAETKILSDQLCEEFVIGTLLNKRKEWALNTHSGASAVSF